MVIFIIVKIKYLLLFVDNNNNKCKSMFLIFWVGAPDLCLLIPALVILKIMLGVISTFHLYGIFIKLCFILCLKSLFENSIVNMLKFMLPQYLIKMFVCYGGLSKQFACVHIHTYIHIHTYTHTCIYIHTYIHTYIYISITMIVLYLICVICHMNICILFIELRNNNNNGNLYNSENQIPFVVC